MYYLGDSFQVADRETPELTVRAKYVLWWIMDKRGLTYPGMSNTKQTWVDPDPSIVASMVTRQDVVWARNSGKVTTRVIWAWLYAHGYIMEEGESISF